MAGDGRRRRRGHPAPEADRRGTAGRPAQGEVVALVAAHDEEDTIEAVVAALYDLGSVDRVVVVADGSTDGTTELARGAGAWVWTLPTRLGKGGALEAALDWVGEASVFVLVDGDVGKTAGAVAALLEEVRSGRLDLAVGVLPPLAGGGLGMVKRGAAALIRAMGGIVVEAPLSGQRVVRAEALQACRPLAGGFGLETAMTIDACRLGFRVGEVPVAMRHRPTGRGPAGFLHRGRQGAHIVRAVVPRAVGIR